MQRKFVEPTEALKQFYLEVRRLKTLTQEEERELLKNKTPENRQKVLNANQRYVITIAKQFSTVPDVILELISEGNIGLSDAMDKYNPDENVGFLTFSRHYIRRSMSEFFEKSSIIQEHKGIKRAQYLASKFEERFFSENGYYPSDDMIKDYLRGYKGFNYCEDWNIRETKTTAAESTDSTREDGDNPCGVVIADDSDNITEHMEEVTRKENVCKLLSELNDTEKKVIMYTYGIGTPDIPDMLIAERLHTTEKLVNKIRKKALQKMRVKAMHRVFI